MTHTLESAEDGAGTPSTGNAPQITDAFWDEDVAGLLQVTPGFQLRGVNPDSTPGTRSDKARGLAQVDYVTRQMRHLQERLYARSWTGSPDRVLVILQAMDAAGKGGLVNHVFGSLKPYGLELTAFKAPTPEERAHDFLWRVEPHVPAPGSIGLFDRSHYEDVLVQRVHRLAPPEEIERRYGAINDFERRITDDGVRIVKVMLHISPDEQYRRLLARLEATDKHWKYSPSDTSERSRWSEYMEAFQIAIDRTHTPHAPWHVVPANSKWYARAAVQKLVLTELEQLDLGWPAAEYDVASEIARLNETRNLRWP